MTPCPCEPVVVQAISSNDVCYAGSECRLCGARNISNNARPGELDRVVVDLFVGWMMRCEEIGVDPDSGDIVAYRIVSPRVPVLGIERGGLKLAALNHSRSRETV